MKKYLLKFLLVFFVSISFAQAPEGYYSTAHGKQGQDLMEALHYIIKDHTVLSYTPGVWEAMYYTDRKANGDVWDMYSDKPDGTPAYTYTFFDDQCGNYSGEGSCYNREHSFPKSWFNDASPMYTDIFHLYPTDGYVNGQRGNLPFGEVSNADWTSTNGSKKGSNSYPGYSGTVFEPIDEYKGDFARTYFYMATRYYDQMYTWSNVVTNGTQHPAYEEWVVNLLLDWHANDPVSEKEINRNNVIFESYQHNRNPFIDHPEYVLSIWGDETVVEYTVQFTVTDGTNPIQGAQVVVTGHPALPTTNASGQTATQLASGDYTYSVSANGYNFVNGSFSVGVSDISIPVSLNLSQGDDEGQALLVEYFKYQAGQNLIDNGWTSHSGTSGDIKIVSPALEFDNYHGSGVGNAVALYDNGQDVNVNFPEQTQGTVYVAFTVQTQTTNAEGYFLHLGQTELETNFFTRVWVNATGTGLGIGSSTPSSFVTITTDTPWLAVVKLSLDTKQSQLFVFSSFPYAEPAEAHASFAETASFSNVGTIALRQFSANQRVMVDGIRVATSWTEAVYGSGDEPPSAYTVKFSVINVDGQPHGTLTATANGDDISTGDAVGQGAEVVFTASPASGYELDTWVINGQEDETITDLTFSIDNLTQDVDVSVRFRAIPPATYLITFGVVTIDGGPHGTLTAMANGDDISTGDAVGQGAEVVFTASPASGYELDTWVINGQEDETITDLTFSIDNLTQDVDVSVRFKAIPPVTYSVTFGVVTVDDAPHGILEASSQSESISSGDRLNEGSSIVFVANPDNGYEVKAWAVNGETIADFTEVAYTILSLKKDVVVTVEFEMVTSAPMGWINKVTLHPNPFTNTIKLDNSELVSRVVVTDMIGKQVMVIDLNGENVVNTSSLREGVYLIILENQNGQRVVRRMIKR
jgi:endonuclease I